MGGNGDALKFVCPFSGGGGPGLRTGGYGARDIGAGFGGAYGDATIHSFDTNIHSDRFGYPAMYQLRRVDATSQEMQEPVHWSRIIHLAEGCLDNDVYGMPRLERVWNLLDDLEKVTGGGAEAFWLRANQGLHLNVDKELDMKTAEREALSQQVEEYQHQLRRAIKTRGVDVEVLGSDTAKFGDSADAILTQIAGALAIPKRVLTGSEMGELASSQDRDNWKDQINGRQTGYAEPYIVRPVVDRLIAYGYLPSPIKGVREYQVVWPHIETLTENEKVTGAEGWARVNQTAGTLVFLPEEIRSKWAGMEPLTPEQLAAATKQIEDAQPTPKEDPNVLLKLKGGKKDEEEEEEEEKEDKKKKFPRAAQEFDHRDELLQVLEEAVRANNTEVIHAILGVGSETEKFLEEHSYSSTQIQLPAAVAAKMKALQDLISAEDLNEEGLEGDLHITVKYGLETQDPVDVQIAVQGYKKNIGFTLGRTGYFSAPDHDVLQVAVSSECLHEMNRLLCENLSYADTHPYYQPHVTLAYLKKGRGAKYAGRADVEGVSGEVTELVFSDSDGDKTVIALA